MKKTLLIFALILSVTILFVACGGSGEQNSNTANEPAATADTSTAAATATSTDTTANGNPSYDPKRGEGKFHNVKLSDKLDPAMAAAGDKLYELKCSSCHKLTDERLVGPGWKGVTKRHQPEWILNFVTNTDEMLEKDPKAQAMLEICMVRMPNQNLTDQEALDVLEFMRKNDGLK